MIPRPTRRKTEAQPPFSKAYGVESCPSPENKFEFVILANYFIHFKIKKHILFPSTEV
jgi:hypothetical protein